MIIKQDRLEHNQSQIYKAMDDKKSNKQMPISQYANNLITDMKILSNTLKPINKNIYESNNRILNELLVAKDDQLFDMVIKVLTHTLQVAQYKTLLVHVLAILNKTIICIKTVNTSELSAARIDTFIYIVNQIVDILMAVSTQQSQPQQISLRILQSAFSLIDHVLVPMFSTTIITKLFAIMFQFCNGYSILQNISVSALFALVQAIFQFGNIKDGFQVLTMLLQYLFQNKKYVWAKGKDVKGLIWDLTVVAVKNFNIQHIRALEKYPECHKLLTKMYDIVLQSIFLKKSKTFYNPILPTHAQTRPNNNNSNHLSQSPLYQSTQISDFTRCFKAYIWLSTSLSINSMKQIQKQLVGFQVSIPKLILVCDLQRNSRMYIFMEAICFLLLQQYDMPLSVAMDKGLLFIQILSKISQQLCWCNCDIQGNNNQTQSTNNNNNSVIKGGIKVNWYHQQSYLDKVVNQQPKINDGDFVRLIKNTITQLRIKYQKDQDLINAKKNKKLNKQDGHHRNNHSNGSGSGKDTPRNMNLPQNIGNSKKWEVFIKNLVRIIRYLSSLNFITQQTQQDPTRKIILQLQYWFLLCPISKAKNMILQQLLITANVLNNKMQAIKVSQSVQIGCNILYGYYDDLDSMGLTIILKMMAGIKADWEQGKSFQQLDQVYNLVSAIFTQQSLVKTEASFLMTIQALVQCVSSLIADIEQPKQKSASSSSANSQHSSKRSYKMIQFLLQKLIVVVGNNLSRSVMQWNFITGFLITLCINKNMRIRELGIKCIGILVSKLLKTELGQQIDAKKQVDILALYQQLSKSKLQNKQLELALIQQLKSMMPRIRKQNAVMDGFRIVKILSDHHPNINISNENNTVNNSNKIADIITSIHQLQQILIKQCLHRITEIKYLKLIVQGIQIKASQKNQQYRLINLLWAISDYFKNITPHQNISNQYIQLWQSLFKCLWVICESSKQCQTKQSAIHTTTQIMGEILQLLPFDFVIAIITKYYHQMVLLLLGIHPSSIVNSQKSAQTAKTVLKNYIKLFKKLLTATQKHEADRQQIANNFNTINSNITAYINSHVQKQNTGTITQQLLYQLCFFINAVQQDKGFRQYSGVTQGTRLMFNTIQELIKFCEDNASNTTAKIDKQKIDVKSHMFKKKLKQIVEKIKQAQQLQKKKQMNIESQKVQEVR